MDIVNDSIFISVRIFEDDFEIALNDNSIKLGTQSSTTIIQDYMYENLVIEVDELPVQYEIISRDKTDLSIWIEAYAKIPKDIDNISITNTLLFNSFSKQKNLLIVNLYGSEKGYEFNIKETQIEIPIKK